MKKRKYYGLGQLHNLHIIQLACRESLKAGEELIKPKMEQLLKDLENTLNPYTYPHGRPTIINLSIAEMEKRFKRSGW